MEDSSFVTAVLVPIGVAGVMLSLGLALTLDDFRRVVVYPRGVMIGLFNLFLISPFLAFAMAELFNLSPAMAVGLVLLGAAPGGAMANMLTHLARGDTALSITMTAISSMAAVVTMPLYLDAAINFFDANDLGGEPNMWGIVARVFAITVVPLAIGMRIRSVRAESVVAAGPRFKRIALVLFVVIVAGAVVSEFDRVMENFTDVALAALALNLAAMSCSFTIARVARVSPPQATAIAIELGMHNATVAIAVATAISNELTIPAAVYSVFMFITAGLFAKLMHSRNAGPDALAAKGLGDGGGELKPRAADSAVA